jgi:hypothetical protein
MEITEIEKKKEERVKLREAIDCKHRKIKKICHMLTRNRFEYQTMIHKHNELDREIFEATVGIKKIRRKTSGKDIAALNKIALSDAFLDSLSTEMQQKLLRRLQGKDELSTIGKVNKGLSEIK